MPELLNFVSILENVRLLYKNKLQIHDSQIGHYTLSKLVRRRCLLYSLAEIYFI